MTPSGPFAGHRVLDLSAGIPGAYAGKLLADAGADVVLVEDPAGNPLRRRTASGACRAGDDGALFRHLSAGKRSLVAECAGDVQSLLADADAVIWSADSVLGGLPELGPRELRRAAPHAAVLAISPFGLTGPWAGRAATPFTLQAWSGAIAQRGSPDRPPVQIGGRLGQWITGMFGAVGLLTARWRRLRTGTGELVDVSELECAAFALTLAPVTYRSMAGQPLKPVRSLNFPGVERTKDGWVGFMVVTGQQWLDFCALVEQQEWMDDPELIQFTKRLYRRAEVGPSIERWMSEHTTEEVLDLAALLRVPAAPVGNGATVVGFDHFVQRESFVVDSAGLRSPAVPYRISSASLPTLAPAPCLGEHTGAIEAPAAPPPILGTPRELPFAGLRVADFTAMWAGPIVGYTLAQLGAEVFHVESTRRPDGMRAQSTRRLDEPDWWEWAPLFQAANTNKRGVTIDMTSEDGRALARRLVAECDVVLENFSPRVVESWGLTYAELSAARPDVIVVRMPAYGLDGPWRDRTGYAQTMEQISGMAWVTGYPDEQPQVPNGPCDPIAGTHALIGLLGALEQRRTTGRGALVEAPMVASALSMAAEQVVEYSAYGWLIERDGNRDDLAAPQGLFRTTDIVAPSGLADRWVAISVETDAQWAALRDGIDIREWVADRALDDAAGRRADQEAIEQQLAAWCASRTAEEVVAALWPRGVPVAVVVQQHEQDEVEQLRARGYFHRLIHPVTGQVTYNRYPVVFEHGPARPLRMPAPCLGQHNDDVFGGLLGLGVDELARLAAGGVIGREPPS